MSILRLRPRLRLIQGGQKNRVVRLRPRTFDTVRRYNERGEAVYLTAIMTAPHWISGGGCA